MLRNKLFDVVFHWVMSTIYAYALARTILSATILEVEGGPLLRLCVLLSAVWCLLFWNRRSTLAGLGILLLAGAGTFFFLYRQDFEAQWWLELSAQAKELFQFIQGAIPYRPEYSQLISQGLALLITFVAALNLRAGSGFYVLTALTVAVCAVPLYMDWGVDPWFLALLALCLLALLVHRLNLFAVLRDQYGEKSVGAFGLLLLPLCAAVFLLAGSAPKPDVEAIKEQGLPDISSLTDNLLYRLMPDQIFSWSEDGEQLGGPRSPNDVFVMEVSAPGPLYLSGSIRDIYTGSSWRQLQTGHTPLDETAGEYSVNPYGDLLEQQLYYMRFYAQREENISVTVGEARTKAIFSPPYVQGLSIEDISPSIDDYGMLQADKPLSKEQRYTQRYIAWDFSNSYLQRVLRELTAIQSKPAPQDEEVLTCLTLPEELPTRVKELALSLTQGMDNDYDKLLAIQSYLSQFPYTLTPDVVPTGEDFVDYFLFTGQEGYCVYFATAMAVLGRSADIPTRYVEGFLLPEEINAAGNYTVTNRQAHAWVEAWIPSFGWVVIDPTPSAGGGTPLPTPQPEVSQPEESQSSSPEESSRPEAPVPTPTLPSEVEEPEASTPDEASEPSLPASPEEKPSEEAPASNGSAAWVWVILLLLATGAGGTLWVRWRLASYQKSLLELEQLPNREAVIGWFGRIVKGTAALGYVMEPGETALAFAQRAEQALSAAGQPVDLDGPARIFCLACYSRQEISDEQRERLKACYQQLTLCLEQAQRHRAIYFWKRYLLHQF